MSSHPVASSRNPPKTIAINLHTTRLKHKSLKKQDSFTFKRGKTLEQLQHDVEGLAKRSGARGRQLIRRGGVLRSVSVDEEGAGNAAKNDTVHDEEVFGHEQPLIGARDDGQRGEYNRFGYRVRERRKWTDALDEDNAEPYDVPATRENAKRKISPQSSTRSKSTRRSEDYSDAHDFSEDDLEYESSQQLFHDPPIQHRSPDNIPRRPPVDSDTVTPSRRQHRLPSPHSMPSIPQPSAQAPHAARQNRTTRNVEHEDAQSHDFVDDTDGESSSSTAPLQFDEEIAQHIEDILSQEPQHASLESLHATMRHYYAMCHTLSNRTHHLQVMKIGLLMQRNIYSDKLRNVQRYGERSDLEHFEEDDKFEREGTKKHWWRDELSRLFDVRKEAELTR